jgi:transaldolase/glucose-6-phosphate isomerase
MTGSPASKLLELGQSPWLDYIRRSLVTSGELRRMVDTGEITGVTVNPTILEKAIVGSQDYDATIRQRLSSDPDLPALELYEHLAVEDVTLAADVLRGIYDRTGGRDGYVSLEVAPGLAHDTQGTVAEARRLWSEVNRPNLLIKVPATKEGIPAIEELLATGVNVNITLMFSQRHYEEVAQAYLRALGRNPLPGKLGSVASVFVSRIDTAVDRLLSTQPSGLAQGLSGQVAIANAKVIYARYRELFTGAAFAPLAARGAKSQRVLWASTSTKDPRYRDTLYVEELVGPDTVDTIPPATLTAFQDHGKVRGATLLEGVEEARQKLKALASLGIDLGAVCDKLQDEGLNAFSDSYAHLLASLEEKRRALVGTKIDRELLHLGTATDAVNSRLSEWERSQVPRRFWKQDPTLWPQADPKDVATRMGWLTLPEVMEEQLPDILSFVEEVKRDGYRQAVVLGMGGSSLAPSVFARMFPPSPGFLSLLVLDSTHPDAVRHLREGLDLERTLFLVSSKSGTTTEPNAFADYFWEELRSRKIPPGPHFAAITDPGTALEKRAESQGFRRTFRAVPTVGGRYSALTHFGLVPAALLGVDLPLLLGRAWAMAEACAASVPAPESPGLKLGAVLGELATRDHRDKVTVYADGVLAPFPIWAEQLIAESTGKIGKGLVPVVDEPFTAPDRYGKDRVFVALYPSGGPSAPLAGHLQALETLGHPTVQLEVPHTRDLGQEFFRWEFAVAASGMILGINPYDQPDVEFAKELAREAMARPAAAGSSSLPPPVPAADERALLHAFVDLSQAARPGDYVAVQAYLAPNPQTDQALEGIRRSLLERFRLATTLGYGPRFLHSTGQLHKGGPNTGLFVQIVDTPKHDVPVPGAGFTFGELIRAQAQGDCQALLQKGRRVLRIDLGSDVPGGLARLQRAIHG